MLTLLNLEVLAWHNEVVAIVASRDLAAVGTVAKGLHCISLDLPGLLHSTYHHVRLAAVLDLDVSTETTSGRHVGRIC